MTKFVIRGSLMLGLFASATLLTAGCGKTDGTGGGPVAENKDKDKGKGKVDDSETWWCPEHGVPEDVCTLCSKKSLIPESKQKGDWCEEHGRPESHCFLCNPKRAEKFAAEYRARYGKEPPPIEPEHIKGGKKN